MAAPARIAGFVGLGVMGSAMSSRLLAAGWEVIGYDIDPGRLAEHGARGGTCARSPADVAAHAGVVVTSLPSAQALRDAAMAEHGLGARPAPGLTVIETSTLPVTVKEGVRDYLAARGADLLDCPVSGTSAQARNNDLVAYLSGEGEAKVRAREVLRAMTRACHDVGAFGCGSKTKMVANLLVAVHNVAAAEALLLAERAGLDLPTVLAAVADGAGSSRMFEIRGPQMAAGEYRPAAMRAGLFSKDIELIASFARESSSPAPLFTLASVFYQAALAQGRAEEDTACVHAVMRQLAGAEPRC
jgi:3-hydroxyisobutyrate dehydrogenase-like beta-hydroxyacid dehydrogenase